MLTHDLVQVVKQPTREQGSSHAILDLVFLSRDFYEYTVLIEKGLSDHHLVSVTIPLINCVTPKRATLRSFKDYSRSNDASIVEYMESCYTDFIDHEGDVHALWSRCTEMYHHCINTFVPTKCKKIAKNTPWITRTIIHLKRKLKRLKKNNPRFAVIHELKINLARTLRESKAFNFKTTLPNFLKNDPNKFLNFLSDGKRQVSQILVNGKTVTDLKVIAEHFNTFFHSVFAKTSLTTSHPRLFQPTDVDFISYSGVVSMILNLNTKSSCGPDNIPNVFLRRYAEIIAHFVIVLFRCSRLTAKLPSDCKRARVVPIFKKGNHLLLENYCPISLTSPISKMLEHVISKRSAEFLEQNSILTNFQHGFRQGYSTVTQLVTVVHSFAEALDNNGQMDVIFLDFSKAFDKVIRHKLP